MELSKEQRRTLIGLACAVAWADGVVTPEEESMIHRLASQFGEEVGSLDELKGWLNEGLPNDLSLASLPHSLGQMFFYQAMALSEADGEITAGEVRLLDAILTRFFIQRPGGVKNPFARIKLKRLAQDTTKS